ncbi:MAG: site-2 protease family protein [bacterium]
MLIAIFTLIVLLFSIVIHEVAHGSVALSQGDTTAKYAGRLTLNPIKHLDPIGSVLLPLMLLVLILITGQGFIFGWAKPVPVNPNHFKDRKWGELKVSIAGPAANFLIAIVFGLTIRFLPLSESLISLFSLICIYNIVLGLFNLIPMPPLDGSHILFSFLPYRFSRFKIILSQYGFFIVILFLFFFGGIKLLFNASIAIFSMIAG